jgi:broad specificity phosphatase PhoE
VPRLHLVRHGRAAAGWGAHPDPGLDPVGLAQAEAVADRLAPLGPLDLVTSPMRRTRETAAPLARRWGTDPRVEPDVGEIPGPPRGDAGGRSAWLAAAMASTWPERPAGERAWRDRVVATLLALPADAVVVTHFVAVNVAVGAATGDDRVMCFRPANASVTVVDTDGSGLVLVAAGEEGATFVLPA